MRSLMRSNLFRLAVLLWFAGWLVMVMPGHKRGIVQLPDAEAQTQTASCCPPQPSCCQPAGDAEPTCGMPGDDLCEQPTDGEDRPVDPAKHCAICFLKAHLTDAPPVTLYTPYLGELDELAFHVESSIADDQAAPANLRGRAPPA